MFLTRALRGNLNKRHWDRRVWQIGYRGPLLPQQKATGRPDYPVRLDDVVVLRERFARELGVMKLLTRPYVSEAAEKDYFTSINVTGLEEIREKVESDKKAALMPGKAKRVDGSRNTIRRRANIGNLLHSHSTIEDSLGSLLERKRWD